MRRFVPRPSLVTAAALVAAAAFVTAARADDQPAAAPAAAPAKAEAAPQPEGHANQLELARLAARDVIEKLKTIRSEIVLEEEQIRLLKARLQRRELENQLAAVSGKAPPPKAPSGPSRPGMAGASARSDEEAELAVKAVTVQPFKEAIVTYRGRVYTVRPGDKLGPIEIKDVTESGVVTSGSRVLMNH